MRWWVVNLEAQMKGNRQFNFIAFLNLDADITVFAIGKKLKGQVLIADISSISWQFPSFRLNKFLTFVSWNSKISKNKSKKWTFFSVQKSILVILHIYLNCVITPRLPLQCFNIKKYIFTMSIRWLTAFLWDIQH